jgi:hypothetical protein
MKERLGPVARPTERTAPVVAGALVLTLELRISRLALASVKYITPCVSMKQSFNWMTCDRL